MPCEKGIGSNGPVSSQAEFSKCIEAIRSGGIAIFRLSYKRRITSTVAEPPWLSGPELRSDWGYRIRENPSTANQELGIGAIVRMMSTAVFRWCGPPPLKKTFPVYRRILWPSMTQKDIDTGGWAH